MADLEFVKVPLNKLEARVRSREDMYRVLQDACRSCLTIGKFYMPELRYCTV